MDRYDELMNNLLADYSEYRAGKKVPDKKKDCVCEYRDLANGHAPGCPVKGTMLPRRATYMPLKRGK